METKDIKLGDRVIWDASKYYFYDEKCLKLKGIVVEIKNSFIQVEFDENLDDFDIRTAIDPVGKPNYCRVIRIRELELIEELEDDEQFEDDPELYEANFSNSPLEIKKETFSINRNDIGLKLEGKTHGKMSHAIKHLYEFNELLVNKLINMTIEKIKTSNIHLILDKNMNIVYEGDNALFKINQLNIINFLQLINDKYMLRKDLNNIEKNILETVIVKMTNVYDKKIDLYVNNAKTIEQDPNALENGHILKFNAFYKNNPITYFLNPSNTAIIPMNNKGDVYTMYRLDKKGNNLNKVKDYFVRQNIQISDPKVKNVLNISENKIFNFSQFLKLIYM